MCGIIFTLWIHFKLLVHSGWKSSMKNEKEKCKISKENIIVWLRWFFSCHIWSGGWLFISFNIIFLFIIFDRIGLSHVPLNGHRWWLFITFFKWSNLISCSKVNRKTQNCIRSANKQKSKIKKKRKEKRRKFIVK